MALNLYSTPLRFVCVLSSTVIWCSCHCLPVPAPVSPPASPPQATGVPVMLSGLRSASRSSCLYCQSMPLTRHRYVTQFKLVCISALPPMFMRPASPPFRCQGGLNTGAGGRCAASTPHSVNYVLRSACLTVVNTQRDGIAKKHFKKVLRASLKMLFSLPVITFNDASFLTTPPELLDILTKS